MNPLEPVRATPGQEPGRRRRLLLWSAVPVFLALCVAAKLLSLGVLGEQAAGAFGAGDAAAVQKAADGLNLANVVEQHKAPFAAGDARALAGDYAAARHLFQEALAAVPEGSADECSVRINLSLAIERMGDEKVKAEDPASAAALFAEALDVAGAAPEGCFAPGTAPGAGQQLTDAEARLNDKLAAAQRAGSADGDTGEDTTDQQEQPQQSQLEQLKENARQAERERNAGREREEYLEDTDYAAGPGRPW